MSTTVQPQAKPPGLPLGRVRTGWQLLVKPDLLSGELLFGDAGGDLVHWRVGRQHFFASRSPDHVEHVFVELGGDELHLELHPAGRDARATVLLSPALGGHARAYTPLLAVGQLVPLILSW